MEQRKSQQLGSNQLNCQERGGAGQVETGGQSKPHGIAEMKAAGTPNHLPRLKTQKA